MQERKGEVKDRMREQQLRHETQEQRRADTDAALAIKLQSVPRALHRLHKRVKDA